MAQRQFRTDDTSLWVDRYGAGGDGAISETTSTDAPIDSACTGTSGTTSLTATNASFAAGQIIVIDQTQGTGADVAPSWELNKIQSYIAGTITLSYPLTKTYTTGAQVLVVKQATSYSLNGATLTAKIWDGTVGGFIARLVNGTFNGTGTITLVSKGFIGDDGRGPNGVGDTGEGYPGPKLASTTAANGNGGGGGPNNNEAAAGGGNGAVGGNNNNNNSNGGLAAGNASLTIFSMGGGGGSGSNQSGAGLSGAGGQGGAKLLIIAKTVDVSGMTITLTGGNGATSTGSDGSPGPGGGGAGGSALIKGQVVVLGTNKITASGGSGATGGGHTSGNGAVGRVHVDYSSSLSGTTTPTLDSSVDTVFNDLITDTGYVYFM